MIADGLYWGSPSKPIKLAESVEAESVEVKVETIKKATKKKDNYHSISRLLLGDIVCSPIGDQVDIILPSGRRSNARKKCLGEY